MNPRNKQSKRNRSIPFVYRDRFSILYQTNHSGTAKSFIQFIKFCLVGVTNTALSYAINVSTLFLLRPLMLSFDYIIANLIAFLLSVAWSFFWNSRFVFRTDSTGRYGKLKTLLKTYAAYAFTGILLNNILSLLWIEKLDVSKYVAPLINLIISVPINFLINKFWAFKER